MNFEAIIEFWFDELTPAQWFTQNDDVDSKIKHKFKAIHQSASCCELTSWRISPLGRLAEIIVLDQFSRNLYRGTRAAFQCDPLALALSQEAINLKIHEELSPVQRSFLFLPFMHSESKFIHTIAVELFSSLGRENSLEFEYKHKAIIDRFGRYPHRNVILKRKSTPEEIAFLQEPDSSF